MVGLGKKKLDIPERNEYKTFHQQTIESAGDTQDVSFEAFNGKIPQTCYIRYKINQVNLTLNTTFKNNIIRNFISAFLFRVINVLLILCVR